MVLLSELPEDIERFAVLRWDEQRVLIGATGLLPIDQPALQLTDEDPAFVSLAGFSRIQLETMRLPELATLEAAPLRLAGANDERLPTPAIYLDGPVGPGLVDLEATPAPALSAGWVESACPRTTPERPERLSASGHILGLLGLDARSALAVVNERARTMLFRADIELTEALHPPGFDDAGGPGTWRTSAAHFENGVLYLASWPDDGTTRIYAGSLEAGLALVTTSTLAGQVAWLAPDHSVQGDLWLVSAAGRVYRHHAGRPEWALLVELGAGVPTHGAGARLLDGSLLLLHRKYGDRQIARVGADGTLDVIPRDSFDVPVSLMEHEPEPVVLTHDSISSRLFEVRDQALVSLPGSEEGVPTVEPLVLAKLGRGFAISGTRGFLALYWDGAFCPVESGVLGNDTVEHLVEVGGGFLSAPGIVRNPAGPANLTRVSFD